MLFLGSSHIVCVNKESLSLCFSITNNLCSLFLCFSYAGISNLL